MGALTTFAKVWSIFLLCLAYYSYTPMPDHAREPLKQRFVAASVRAIKDLAYIGDGIGLGSSINITRTLVNFNQYLSQENDDGTIEADDEIFDGVKVRVYTPVTAHENSQGLVYIHGGGWALLSVDAYDAFCRQLVKATNIVIISVEYRLAPEHTFPVPLEDCVKATRYFINNAHHYGVDPNRIGVAGDSAGGNLAMATSLKFIDDKSLEHDVKLTALIYPLLQAFDTMLPSYVKYDTYRGPSFSTKNTLIFYIQQYAFGVTNMTADLRNNTHLSKELRTKYEKFVTQDLLPENLQTEFKPIKQEATLNDKSALVLLDPYFSPLLANDDMLKKLPPMYVMTCDFDALRDDGFILARRLKNINHDVTHVHMEGLEHGFVLLHFYESAASYVNSFARYLTSKL